MTRPRPGDRIYVPARVGTATGSDEFAGGMCTVDGVYAPSVAETVATPTGTADVPRALQELTRGGSASTWVSVAEDPGSWFEWERYLVWHQEGTDAERRDRQAHAAPSHSVKPHHEHLDTANHESKHISSLHSHMWLRPTPWAGFPADVELADWQLRVAVTGRAYIDVPVSWIHDVGTRW